METHLEMLQRHVLEGAFRIDRQLAGIERWEERGTAAYSAKMRLFLAEMIEHQASAEARLKVASRHEVSDPTAAQDSCGGTSHVEDFTSWLPSILPAVGEAVGALQIVRFALCSLKIELRAAGPLPLPYLIAEQHLEAAQRLLNLEDDSLSVRG